MRTLKLFAVCTLVIASFAFGKSLSAPERLQEKHPEMMAGKKHLEEARTNLKKAAHDYNGHRVKAIEHIDKAIKEIEEGIASEK